MTIEKAPPFGGRVTSQWIIRSKSQGTVLGDISWYANWRQYCFMPREDCIFNGGCLSDIVAFLQTANQAHKADRLAKGELREPTGRTTMQRLG